ncbi:MAG: hypothetical protein ACI8WB_005526 [Phenylobacterium sp.]|jgi:hypothetical protein
MTAETFNITRIHTSQGIFSLSGHWQRDDGDNPLHISQLAMMGTDGWMPLDTKQPAVMAVLNSLMAQFVEHLDD